MSGNRDTVTSFIDACNAKDMERLLGLIAPECVYHNIPLQPVTGPDGVRAVLDGIFPQAREVDWVVHQIAETEAGVVLTERTDRFLIGEKWVELPVMGAFEVQGGKITAWRDYFDMQQFQSQMAS